MPSASVPPRGPSPAPPAPRSRSRQAQRWARWLLPLAAAAALGAALGVGVAAAIHMPRVESLSEYRPGLITQLRDRDGQVFATYARERRVLLQEGELPTLLQRAVIAAEDADFFRHGGIDALGVLRSMLVNLRRGRHAQGASTITMQLARQLFLTRQKTWKRKIEEAFLAVELEKTLSKQQILTLYCNIFFLGHGNYGMEAASRYYFGHGVRELSLPEAATLAGIVQRPSEFSPYRSPDKVVARRDYVLRRMREEGYIDDDAYRTARAAPLEVVERHRAETEPALYFAEEVRQQLENVDSAPTASTATVCRWPARSTAVVQKAAEAACATGCCDSITARAGAARSRAARALDLEGDTLERQVGRNPVPESWSPGLVLEAKGTARACASPIGRSRSARAPIAWTGRRRPAELLRAGDIAWFRPGRLESRASRTGSSSRSPSSRAP